MGAQTFEQIGYGATPQEAFQNARQDACHEYGHGGYTGSLAEKDDFVVIEVPRGIEPEWYADSLIGDDDRRIRDKWGPAGCILLEKGTVTVRDTEVKTAKIDNIPAQGTKQWKTYYSIYNQQGKIQNYQYEKKADALKAARQLSIRHKEDLEVRVEKLLSNESPVVARVTPNRKVVERKAPQNKYLFFGWASS